MFDPLDSTAFKEPRTPHNPGPAPQLTWIPLEQLVLDSSYQRTIGRRGVRNVNIIAETFDWSKFAPVIVAPVEGGKFAIVDGQHRSTAAMIRGISEVPCQVVQADRAKQAEAFAAVNGNITKTTPQQIFHARVAAGDAEAILLQEACAIGGVEVLRKNKVNGDLAKGETQAIGALRRCFVQYGRDTLITALQCITQTSDGNPGFVKATIVEALCAVLHKEAAWRDAGDRLLRAMDDFEFADAWEETMAGRNFVLCQAVLTAFAERVRDHLSRSLSTLPAPTTPGTKVASPKGRRRQASSGANDDGSRLAA